MRIFDSKLLSATEREYAKQIDELILKATPEELQQIQELDLQTQLKGNSFYDVMAESKSNDSTKVQLSNYSKRKNN